MADYKVNAPNGMTYTLEGPEGLSEDQLLSYLYREDPTIFTPARAESEAAAKDAGFLGSLAGTTESLMGSARTALDVALGEDATEAAARGVQRQEQIDKAYGEMASLDRLKEAYNRRGVLGGLGQFIGDIPSMAGQAIPTVGTALTGAAIGSRAGALFGPTGALVGTIGGGILANTPIWPGSNIERQYSTQIEQGIERPEIDVPKAVAAGVAQSAAEGVGAVGVLGRNLVMRLLGSDLTSKRAADKLITEAQRSLTSTAVRGGARGAATNLPVDVAQQVIERYQAGLDVLGDEALAEYGNVAYISAGGGGGLGAASGPLNRAAARNELERRSIDYRTGERLISPEQEAEISAERQALLEEEQKSANYMARQAALRESGELAVSDEVLTEMQDVLDRPLDLGRTDAAITNELRGLNKRLMEIGKDLGITPVPSPERMSPEDLNTPAKVRRAQAAYSEYVDRLRDVAGPLVGRINNLESTLVERDLIRGAPEADAQRRAQQAKEARGDLPPSLRGDRAAYNMFRALHDGKDVVVQEALATRLSQTENRSESQNLELRALTDSIRETRQAQQRELSIDNQRRSALEADARMREQELNRARQLMPESQRAESRARVFVDQEASTMNRAQLDAEVKELSAKKKRDVSEDMRLEAALRALPVINDAKLNDLGIRRGTKVYKALEGIDVETDAGRAQATAIIGRLMSDPKVAPNTKDKLQGLMAHPAFAGRDLAPLPPLSAQTIPTNEPLTNEALEALGVGKRTTLYRSGELPLYDPNTSEGLRTITEALGEFGRATKRPQVRENINNFLRRLNNDQGSTYEAPEPHTPRTARTAEPTDLGEGVAVVRQNIPQPERGAEPAPAGTATTEPAGVVTDTGPNIGNLAGKVGADAALANENPANVGGDAYMAARGSGDLAGSFTPDFLEAVDAGDIRGALNVIVNNESDGFGPLEATVASRMLESELPFPRIEVHDRLFNARGQEVAGRYDSTTDTVQLVRGEVDSHTLLHELMHGFTHRFLNDQQSKGYSDPNAKALLDLYAHVRRVMPDSGEYGLTNLSEFVAEAMSNPEFQLELMGIPYKQTTLWSKFKDALKKLFGVETNNPVDTALFSALVHAEGLMNPGRQMQVDNLGVPIPNPIVDVIRTIDAPDGGLTPEDYRNIARAPNQEVRTTVKRFLSNFQRGASEVDPVTRFRVKTVDQMASVDKKLSALFDNGIRNAMGELNPIHFMRQGAEYNRLAARVFRLGGMRKDPETGFYEAYQLTDVEGNPVSPEQAVEQIRSLAVRYGEDYETAKSRVATVLEGVWQAELRRQNQNLENLAVALEAEGRNAEAFQKREDKVKLHMLNEEMDNYVRIFESSPEIQRVQEILNVTRFNLLDQMVESGRIDAESADRLKSNIAYVPLDRLRDVLETTDLISTGRREGIGALGSFHKLEGSYNRPVANVINNYMDTLAWMVGQTVRNNGTRKVLEAMEEAGFAYRVSFERPASNSELVTPPVYEDGKPVRYQLENEYDMAAFVQADTPDGSVINGLAATARILRGTITAIPTFALNMNVQDLPRVGMTIGTKSIPTAALLLKKFPVTVANNLRGAESLTGESLHNFAVVGDFDYNPIDPLSSLESDSGAIKQGVTRRALNRLEQIAKASDQASREAIYERTMLETGDKALAIMRAREYINYNRRGASRTARVLTRTVPFFNAYAQGMDIIYRGMKGQGASSGLNSKAARRYIGGRIALMTAMGLAYAAFMSDDEDYKNAPEHLRNKGFILPRAFSSLFDGEDGRHTPLIIPQPRELSFMYMVLPRKLVQYMDDNTRGEDREAWDVVKEVLKTGAETYLMQPIPPGIKQAIEYYTNHSFFTGQDLVSPHLQNMPTHMQINRDTSLLAESLGRNLGLSPIKLDNLIKGTFGTAGAFALRASDMIARDVYPELPVDKIPGVGPFFGTNVGNRVVNDFYDLKQKVDTAVAGARALQEDPQGYQQFVTENRNYLALRKYMNAKSKQLAQLNKLRDLYMRNSDLDMNAAERRVEIRKLDELRVEILKDIPKIRGLAVRGWQ